MGKYVDGVEAFMGWMMIFLKSLLEQALNHDCFCISDSVVDLGRG